MEGRLPIRATSPVDQTNDSSSSGKSVEAKRAAAEWDFEPEEDELLDTPDKDYCRSCRTTSNGLLPEGSTAPSKCVWFTARDATMCCWMAWTRRMVTSTLDGISDSAGAIRVERGVLGRWLVSN